MASTQKTISERILDAEVAILNALEDEEIKTELAIFGYDETKLNEGKTLYENARESDRKQKEEYGEQYEASQEVKEKWETAGKAYMRALKIARVAFKSNGKAPAALMLEGRRKESLNGWIEQATVFYDTLLSETAFKTEIAKFGYTEEKLTAERDLVTGLIEANRKQEKEKGEAQDATKERDALIDLMDDWMHDFKEVAAVALEDNPQWLEKLGFLARS